jgi:hypothetical protein
VRGTDDPNRLRDFARRYPSSEHAAEAKQRADGLVRAAQEREGQARREKAEAEPAKAWEASAPPRSARRRAAPRPPKNAA